MRKLEKTVYVTMFILLTEGFLPLWRRLTAGVGPVATAEGDPLRQAVFVAGYLLALLLAIGSLGRALKLSIKRPLIALFLLWAVVSVFWSAAPAVSLRKAAAIILATFFSLIFVNRLTFREFLRILGWALLIVLGASLIAGLFLPDVAIISDYRGELWRGVFVQKNLLGRWALWGLLVFSFLWAIRERPRWLWVSALLLAVFLLWKSDSRSSQVLLLMFVALAVFLQIGWHLRRAWPIYVAFALWAVCTLAFIGSSYSNYIYYIFQLTGRDPTFTGRVPLWIAVWGYITENPLLGYGLGAFWLEDTYALEVSNSVGWLAPHSHNGYLDLWLDLGFTGLLLGVAILFSGTLKWIRFYFRTGSLEALFWLLTGAFFWAYNFVESTFLRINTLLWVFLVLYYMRDPEETGRFGWRSYARTCSRYFGLQKSGRA